jgi:hypothetical protein
VTGACTWTSSAARAGARIALAPRREDARGRLYAISLDGPVYRLVDS